MHRGDGERESEAPTANTPLAHDQHFPESRRRLSASCGAGGRGTTGLGAVAAREREAGSVVGGLMMVAGYSQ